MYGQKVGDKSLTSNLSANRFITLGFFRYQAKIFIKPYNHAIFHQKVFMWEDILNHSLTHCFSIFTRSSLTLGAYGSANYIANRFDLKNKTLNLNPAQSGGWLDWWTYNIFHYLAIQLISVGHEIWVSIGQEIWLSIRQETFLIIGQDKFVSIWQENLSALDRKYESALDRNHL